MPLAVALSLYVIAAVALVAGGGAGLIALLEPADRGIARIVASEPAAATAPVAAPATDMPPQPVAANRVPAWIAPTPIYDLPAPQVAKRDIAKAKKKASDKARKARTAKPRRDHIPDLNADARSAYGYAGPPRAVFGHEMP